MTIQIKPSGCALGAEVIGADLCTPLSEPDFAAIREAFYTHEVLFFRGQELTDEDHIRFSARFGTLRQLKLTNVLHAHHPQIMVISNIKKDGQYIGAYDAGVFWHTDGAYLKSPHAISALRALIVPQVDGRVLGDTKFVSVSKAYDALPAAIKQRLEGLQALHSIMFRLKQTLDSGIKKDYGAAVKADLEAVHPVVRVHPVNERKCLYVTEGYTEKILGLPGDESRDLIKELTAHCIKPEFQYRHNWRQHDLVMWDDCATQHQATFDYPAETPRLMHRTTVVSQAAAA
ncbi:MAG: TauD/TfdA family dioxygenase [Betaproteobacteria bacterium]|nr:TauD/TfdA family dioxygenase [Betaproteobacteria bacterium]